MSPPSPDRFLITGCASGIGRHLADEALARGHRVLATDIHLEILVDHAAEAPWPEERARTERLDVRDASSTSPKPPSRSPPRGCSPSKTSPKRSSAESYTNAR